jgi:hypothetical protein
VRSLSVAVYVVCLCLVRTNVARFRWLRIGREWPTQVAVTVGLSAHERVVDHPPANLHENDRVIALAVTRGVTP